MSRIAASRPPTVEARASARGLSVAAERRFEAFRDGVRRDAPDGGWAALRKVARSMYGDAAFAGASPGRLLALDGKQLARLAANPGEARDAFRALQAQGKLPRHAGWTAPEAADVFAHSARAALGKGGRVSFTVATVNDDFTDRKTNVPRVDKHADVTLVQEAREVDLHRALPKSAGVHQNVGRDDQAGTAVVWHRDVATASATGYSLGVEPHGRKMMTRWLNWTDLNVGGTKVRMVSVHRPPGRFKSLWPDFDRHLAAFVKATHGLVVIGMDANQRNPQALARQTGLVWHAPKGSIDGFLTSPGIRVSNLRRLARGSSDHHPVVADFSLPKT